MLHVLHVLLLPCKFTVVSSLQHIVKCHGSTLLPQFLGMYRVSVESEETYLIVMRNMFSHRLVVHRKYDLKVRRNYVTFNHTSHFSLLVNKTMWKLFRLFWPNNVFVFAGLSGGA